VQRERLALYGCAFSHAAAYPRALAFSMTRRSPCSNWTNSSPVAKSSPVPNFCTPKARRIFWISAIARSPLVAFS
jgi:hypothetical protein